MPDPRVEVAFRPRAEPLEPVAAAARSAFARALATRLLARDDDALARLSGVAAGAIVIVLGARDDLPWADGVVYLGRDARAPSLLLPVTLEPDVHPALFERALLARGLGPPIAVLLDPPALASVGSARPIERARLVRWLDAAGASAGAAANT